MKFYYGILFCLSLGFLSFTFPNEKVTDKCAFVVAQDGSGDFTTIQAAIEACKAFPVDRIRIFIKNGVYHEKVFIPSWNNEVSLIGESKDSTIISYGLSEMHVKNISLKNMTLQANK